MLVMYTAYLTTMLGILLETVNEYIITTSSTVPLKVNKLSAHSNKPSAMLLILSEISRNWPNTRSSSHAIDSHSGFCDDSLVSRSNIWSRSSFLLNLPSTSATMSCQVQADL